MERTVALLTRLGWHATFWASTVSALAIVKHRLGVSWEERIRDGMAADLIQRHFECSWEEGEGLMKTLLLDLQRKLSSFFPVEETMRRLESISGPADEVRARKIACWEELKIQVISRLLVSIYSVHLLKQFVVVSMAMVGKSIYLRAVLREESPILQEDLSAANRIFVCLAGRFIQHGTSILGESVRNAVQAIFGKVSLQEPCTRILIDSLLCQVRHEVETACGKNVLDECMFGRIEEMIGSDISPIRRRLFIVMVSEARRWMRSASLKGSFFDNVRAAIDHVLIASLSQGDSSQPVRPLIGIIPKLSHNTQELYSRLPQMSEYRKIAALIFVDEESGVNECFLPAKV